MTRGRSINKFTHDYTYCTIANKILYVGTCNDISNLIAGRVSILDKEVTMRNNRGANVVLGYYNNGIDYNLRAMWGEIGARGDT